MRKYIIILVTIILIVATLSIVAFLDIKFNLRHFFKDLQPESPELCIQVVYNNEIQDQYGNSLFKEETLERGNLGIVFCARGNRDYFGYATGVPETTAQYKIWHIASVVMQGMDFQEHFAGNLFDDTVISPEFRDISIYSDRTENFGGYYDGEGRIYLHGNVKTVCFYMETDRAEEVEKLPNCPFTWEIEDHQSITISYGNIQKAITLESMAEKSSNAKQISGLSSYKRWNRKSFLSDFFQYVKVINDQIYILCEVMNWNGEAFAVVFKYDFNTEQTFYVMSEKISDRVSTNYAFAISEE